MLSFRSCKRKGLIFLLGLLLVSGFFSNSFAAGKSKTSKGKFKLTAKSVLALNLDKEEVLFEKNSDEVRSIASLTKLMTAMVFLESGADLFDTETITREDAYHSAKSRLRIGEKFYLIDLLFVSLMSSDNRATRALVRATGLTEEEFVERMNRKADSLGLVNTHFADPTGLKMDNVSTARECAKLLTLALNDPLISRITTTQEYKFFSLNKRWRNHQATNSNRLLRSDVEVLGGKTGFIGRSGWCVAVMLKNLGERLCVIVLGASSNYRRFAEAKYILKSALEMESLDNLGSLQQAGSLGQ